MPDADYVSVSEGFALRKSWNISRANTVISPTDESVIFSVPGLEQQKAEGPAVGLIIRGHN